MRRHQLSTRALTFGVFVSALGGAVGSEWVRSRQDTEPAATATIVAWVDGDTVDVNAAGLEVRVRLLGVDAPERVSYGGAGECVDPDGAARAQERAAQLAPAGTAVELTDRDGSSYGRPVVRVVADGVDVGERLVRDGLARRWPNGACL